MKKNRIFEEVVEMLSKKYEFVSREEKCTIYGQAYGEFCRVKCSIPVGKYDFPLGIVVDHSYRSDMVSYHVGEYNSGYPVSDFDDKDYIRLINLVTGLPIDKCADMVQLVQDEMEQVATDLEEYMDELIEGCKCM